MSLETLTSEDGTRRVVIDYDFDHDFPSDRDDHWGSAAFPGDGWGYANLTWKGVEYDGVAWAHEHWGLREEIAHRYLRAFYGLLVTMVEYARGYYAYVVTERDEHEPVAAWENRHAGNVDVWTQTLRGSVYTVMLEEAVSWVREDNPAERMTTWAVTDSMGGVIGYERALEEAEAILALGHL